MDVPLRPPADGEPPRLPGLGLPGAALLLPLALPLVLTLVLALAPAGPAGAQLSPGKLSAPHAALEGSARCLDCHQAGQGVSAEKCLTCHRPLAARIAAGAGLHARPDHERCESCHIEHHGREFELVWWGDDGIEGFDHRQTGYALEGAHGGLECRRCHRPELVADPGPLRAAGKDLSRTFLGLDRSNCLSCHEDEHRGQFEAGACLSCHRMDAWRPAPLFDHDRTAFALTGRHRQVACAGCHASQQAADGDDWVPYAGLAFARCTDCHRDPHQGRLGATCESCHTTAGWRGGAQQGFDHERTRFPLRGRHRGLACESCHRPGQMLALPRFERCADCHRDSHLGQFAGRPSSGPGGGPGGELGGGACEDCHTVDGFQPSTFTLERHQRSGYPLEGSHLAVPCTACHATLPVAELAAVAGSAPPGGLLPGQTTAMRFRFAGTRCQDCHGDPHRGEADRFVGPEGCTACHSLDGWRRIAFDHDRTDYPLEGAHQRVACLSCHPVVEAGTPAERIRMRGLETNCAACHRDPHARQLAAPDGGPRCQSCHVTTDWRRLLFDHQRDAAFALDGAHLRTPCAGCHRPETVDGLTFVRYKPLPTDCAGCHAGSGR